MDIQRFKVTPEQNVVAILTKPEVDILRQIMAELRPAVGDPEEVVADGAHNWSGDPVRRRMYPRAYLDPTEEDAENAWQQMVHPGLVRGKMGHHDLMVASLDRVAPAQGRFLLGTPDALEILLSDTEADAWMSAIQDARIFLGFSLELSEEQPEIPDDDPRAGAYTIYEYLSFLQDDLVNALAELL